VTKKTTLLALSMTLAACTPTGGDPDAGGEDPGVVAQCTEPTEVPCQDEAFQQLEFFDNVTDGEIQELESAPTFEHKIDATAGGFNNVSESYVYATFTDEGLEKVDLSDEEAFESMDWDIAFQRFIIRLNSGVSGPSCVSAARTGAGTDFEDVESVDENLTFNTEEYFDPEDCELQPDGSGLGSPGVVLQNYWEYPGCVKMTGNVYIVRRADGRHVKLQVLAYYEDQDACDVGGSFGTGSANIRIKWAFLD
jgi:hypothetical protein